MFLEYYGLKEQPFGDTPDPRFLYPAPEHRQSLEAMVRGVADGLGVQTLTALPGLGKTTLIFSLLERLDANVRVVRIFQTQCTAAEFLGFTLNGLGEARGGTADQAISRLQHYLAACSERRESVLVIVDEAHNLRADVFEVIERLSSSSAVKVLLVGHPELAHKLARFSRLQPPPSGAHSLRSLAEDEVGGYIAHRLAVAGCAGGALFTPAANAVIARGSRGIPREINSLCSAALIRGSARRSRPIDVTDIQSLVEGSISMSAYVASSLAAARPHDPPARSSATAEDTTEPEIAASIRQWLGERRFWTGTAGELLAELGRFHGRERTDRVSADEFIGELQARSNSLRALGIAMDVRKRPGYPRLLSFHSVTPAEEVPAETPRSGASVECEPPSPSITGSPPPPGEADLVRNDEARAVAAAAVSHPPVATERRQAPASTQPVLPSLLAAVEEQADESKERRLRRGVALLVVVCGLASALFYFSSTRRLHLFANATSDPPAAHATKPDDAMADLNRRAQQGDVAAQIALAEHYRDGVGVPRNPQAALRWFEQAASQGDAGAQYELGTELASGGEGIQPDPVAAYAWLVLAVANGHPLSQPALNALGPRLSPDELLSVRFRLGEMYEHGIGTASDFLAADTWLMLGEAGGDARCHEERKILEGHMTKQQIAQAHARAQDWIRRHTAPSPTTLAQH